MLILVLLSTFAMPRCLQEQVVSDAPGSGKSCDHLLLQLL